MGAKKNNYQRLISLQCERMEQIQLINNLLRQLQEHQDRLLEIDSDIMELIQKQIQGQCRKIILPFPQIESLLHQLKKDISLIQSNEHSYQDKDLSIPDKNNGVEIKQLIIRVSETEKNQILANLRTAGYSTLNEYARKMLLDGYVIQWEFDAINELSKEMAVVSRNMSQIVKRANVTNSIYEGDFQDFNNGWKKLQAAMLSTITTMRKLMMRE